VYSREELGLKILLEPSGHLIFDQVLSINLRNEGDMVFATSGLLGLV
jgi:hypothetical protein